MKPRLYLDGCVFGRLLDDPTRDSRVGGERHAAMALMWMIQRGEVAAFTSRWAVDEILKTGDGRVRRSLLGKLSKRIRVVPVAEALIVRALELSETCLSREDALHAALAESIQADFLLTVDGKFARGAESCAILRVGVMGLLLWMRSLIHGGVETEAQERKKPVRPTRRGRR